jgi:hypothetical protein
MNTAVFRHAETVCSPIVPAASWRRHLPGTLARFGLVPLPCEQIEVVLAAVAIAIYAAGQERIQNMIRGT